MNYFLFLSAPLLSWGPSPIQVVVHCSICQSLACNQFNAPQHILPAFSGQIAWFFSPLPVLSFHPLIPSFPLPLSLVSWRRAWRTGVKNGGGFFFSLTLSFSFFIILVCSLPHPLQIWSRLFIYSRFVSSAAGLPQLTRSAYFESYGDLTMSDMLPWPAGLWQGVLLVPEEREKEGLMVREGMYGEGEGRRESGK